MYALAHNPGLPYFQPWQGLGDQQTAQLGVQAGTVGASAGVAAGVATGLISASVVPFIGPAIAAAALGISLLIKNSGCGVTCVETSSWANQAEPLLKNNLDAYFAQPVRYESTQAQALANFDQVWNRLVQMCSEPSTGNAGKRCISDRQAGACTWKQTTSSPLLKYTAYGEPSPGQCWNWFSGYRDPILNDPDVQPDSALQVGTNVVTNAASQLAATTGVTQALQSAGLPPSYAPLIIIGALVLLGVAAL